MDNAHMECRADRLYQKVQKWKEKKFKKHGRPQSSEFEHHFYFNYNCLFTFRLRPHSNNLWIYECEMYNLSAKLVWSTSMQLLPFRPHTHTKICSQFLIPQNKFQLLFNHWKTVCLNVQAVLWLWTVAECPYMSRICAR